MKRRVILMLTMFVLCFFAIPKAVFADGYDETAPIINSISFNKTSVNSGGTFDLTLDILEEDTGVNRLEIYFSGDSGDYGSARVEDLNLECVGGLYLKEPIFTGRHVLSYKVLSENSTASLRISQIEVWDTEGNHRTYWNEGQFLNNNGTFYIKDQNDPNNICTINNGNKIPVTYPDSRDRVAPAIKSATWSTSSITAPGTFSITLDIVEGGSGVKSVGITFNDYSIEATSPSGNKLMDLPASSISWKTGKHTITYKVPTTCKVDTLSISQIDIEDVQGNHRWYWVACGEGLPGNGTSCIYEFEGNNRKCTINNSNKMTIKYPAGVDRVAPEIKSITYSKHSMTKPGTFSLTLDVYDAQSQINGISVCFGDTNKSSGFDINLIQPTKDCSNLKLNSGQYKMTFRVPSNCTAKTLKIISLYISDSKGNVRSYAEPQFVLGSDYDPNDDQLYDYDTKKKCVINGNYIEVKPEFDVKFQSFITNTSNTQRLQEMPDGMTAMITYNKDHDVAKKELFDAIKGTNKKIVFSNNAYQWVFNGTDIVNATKDIKLYYNVQKSSVDDYGSSTAASQLVFKSNGLLPGKAEIRLKSDYLYSMGYGSTLKLYYLKGEELIEEKNPDFNLVIDGSDKWCHFDITHNSKFYVSANKLNRYKSPAAKISSLKAGKASFTVKWAKKKCTGYQIRYSTKSNMSSSKTVTISKAKTVSKQIKKLKRSKKYYVQIRSYKTVKSKKYYSAWSSKKSIKTK